MAYQTPPTAVTGQTLTAADWNTKIRDSLEALTKPSRCKVRRTTNQSIPNNAITAISFDTEDYDTDGFWVVGSPTRLTIPVSGVYHVQGCAVFTANSTGARFVGLRTNGVTTESQLGASGNAVWPTLGSIGYLGLLAATDYLELTVFQSSGAALNIDATNATFLAAHLVAR